MRIVQEFLAAIDALPTRPAAMARYACILAAFPRWTNAIPSDAGFDDPPSIIASGGDILNLCRNILKSGGPVAGISEDFLVFGLSSAAISLIDLMGEPGEKEAIRDAIGKFADPVQALWIVKKDPING